MKATFVHGGLASYSKILIEHRGETLEFDGSVYQPSFKKGTYEPFQQINKYWDRQDTDWQNKVFQFYINTKQIFNEIFDVSKLIMEIRPLINEILDFHNTPELERWIRYHSGVWIPEDLDVEYKYSPDRPGSREQTYLVSDYWELVMMTMKLRLITPIWGEFVELTKKKSGPNFRDLNTYYTIRKTLLESDPAMIRLEAYIEKNVKMDDISIRSSIDGIGSDIFQTNLLATILVRWLSVACLTKGPSDSHLVQVIHKSLRNRLSQNESHQNAVLEKINPNENDDGDDSSSRVEKYKNKPMVAPGEFVAIEKWTEYEDVIASQLLQKELTNDELTSLQTCLDNAKEMETHSFEECQLHLMRWMVHPIISSRSLWDINKFSIMRLAGISQFLLWNTGFKDIAALTTARTINSEGYGSFGSESRAHVPKDLVDKLNTLYPFYKRQPNRKSVKQHNDVVVEIMNLSQELSNHTWFLNMSDQQLTELRGSSVNKTYRVGYDVRIRLAELVIRLQERNKAFLSFYKTY